MVRSSTNEPLEDKKEVTKKRIPARKKAVATGVWPCKINGCNKQFAREADLKRHQRTTKLHSMPGFACPQCDATFTRTDALRRHQKSRHNGIVIEPPEQGTKDGADDDAGSSGSQSNSRSATPSAKGKERAAISRVQPKTVAQSNSTGPSSYYRQHTATTSSYVPSRTPIADAQYAQIALPTSATRLHQATNWDYPHPWPDGAPPQMSPINYHAMPGHIYYPTSPHYRPNEGMTHPPAQPSPEAGSDAQGRPNGSDDHTRPRKSSCDSRTSQATHNGVKELNSASNVTSNDTSNAPVIDPSLDPPLDSPDSASLTEEQVLEITQAAMKAVLEAGGGDSDAVRGAELVSPSRHPGEADVEEEKPKGADIADQRAAEDDANSMQDYSQALERPEPMEHMLTEDGEPMLNPAELLTQESLASPPPS